MAEQPHIDDQDGATDAEFYLPAGIHPSSAGTRFERLWDTLFDHRVDPPR